MDLLTCVIADDLTGAGDAGIQYQKAGHSVYLSLRNEELEIPERTDVLILNSDSRFLSSEEAYRKVFNAVSECRNSGISKFYKKIDSTLRGNIKSEIDAVLEAAELKTAVIAPSAPVKNRTVLKGHCYVGNQLVHNSDAGNDVLNPVRSSYIPDLFKDGYESHTYLLGLEEIRSSRGKEKETIRKIIDTGVRYIICDAELDSDLELLSVLNDMKDVLLVGSSGLAEFLTGGISDDHQCEISDAIPPGRILIVNGSRMEISRLQVDAVIVNRPVCKISLYEKNIVENPVEELNRALSLVDRCEEGHSLLIQSTAIEDNNKSFDINAERKTAEVISTFVGELVSQMLLKKTIEAVILIGGDTSSKIIKALNIEGLEYSGEVLPGIPFGRLIRAANNANLFFISKSGSFGETETLMKLFDFLSGKDIYGVNNAE